MENIVDMSPAAVEELLQVGRSHRCATKLRVGDYAKIRIATAPFLPGQVRGVVFHRFFHFLDSPVLARNDCHCGKMASLEYRAATRAPHATSSSRRMAVSAPAT